MKIHTVILLALVGLFAILSYTNANVEITPEYVKFMIKKYAPCIIYEQKCDTLGRLFQRQLPEMLKNCTIEGCPESKGAKITKLVTIIKDISPDLWNMTITKYNHEE